MHHLPGLPARLLTASSHRLQMSRIQNKFLRRFEGFLTQTVKACFFERPWTDVCRCSAGAMTSSCVMLIRLIYRLADEGANYRGSDVFAPHSPAQADAGSSILQRLTQLETELSTGTPPPNVRCPHNPDYPDRETCLPYHLGAPHLLLILRMTLTSKLNAGKDHSGGLEESISSFLDRIVQDTHQLLQRWACEVAILQRDSQWCLLLIAAHYV